MTEASPEQHAPWLLLMFTLSAKEGSERVEVWRKLKRYGAVSLRASGYFTAAQVSVPRSEKITDESIEVPPSMGTSTALNFQPTGNGRAAITGDFVLLPREVNPVLKTLRDNGIQVTALHSHMLNDRPHLMFMHFWANDDAIKLARGLRAALDQTKSAGGERSAK